jgi:hypothetical protein
MQQGAPQGQPQQGGQDPQMQQIMQYVQQSMQQGAQPVDVAIQLIQQGAQPEMIMQVFVQMGMPEDQAREAIETAMEGGQQQQGTGEEMLQGNASNPDQEMAEQGAQPMDQPGNVAETPMMRFGGAPRRQLRRYENGAAVDPNQEMQAVMQQVQEMMQGGADARQVMEQIQAAAQQGQISPDVATSVMEQLSGMQQAENPQGSDAAMTAQSQDPQQMDPNMAAPEGQMMRFGGNLRKLMTKAYGGDAIPPSMDSKNYAQDRTAMFVNSVKNNAFKSTLDNEFPSLGGNQMAYGGDLPKAVDGFDVTKYKTADEAELAAYRYRAGLSPEEQSKFDIGATLKTWKAPEPTYEAGKNYQYDPNTKQFKAAESTNFGQASDWKPSGQPGIQMTYINSKGETIPASTYNQMFGNQNQGYNYGTSAVNPVAYQNPMNQGLYGNLYAGASPFARLLAGSGNYYSDPRITGANLPGGMNPNQFLGAIGGVDKLTSGMTGTVGDQTWRLGEAEKFKEGSIWKGNRRKGVRYTIDWGSAGAMNPAAPAGPAQGPQNNPNANANASTNPQVRLNTMTQTGGSGMGAMERMDDNLFDQSADNPTATTATTATAPAATVTNSAPAATTVNNTPVATRSGGSGMGMMDDNMDEFPSLSSSQVSTANQSLVAPGSTDVVNPASEVNQVDQNVTPQGQVPFAAQSMMAADQTGQNTETPGFVPNQQYMNYGNPTNTGVPAEFTPAADAVPQEQVLWGQDGFGNKIPVTQPVTQPAAQQVVQPKKQTQNNQKPTQKSNTAVVDYSKIKGGQSQEYYQKILEGMQVDGRVPWGVNEKEYFRIIDLSNQAEKNAAWNKKAKYAQTLFSSDMNDPTRENWTEADMNAWRAGNPSRSHEENKKAYLASKEGKKWIASLNPRSFGGNVDPIALENAVALINRAFGGMIPRANNGMDLGSQDTNGNGIPDYLEAENLPANQPNPFDKSGTIEESNAKKLNIDWNAAGDLYMNTAAKVTNFANKMNAMNPERDMAKFSALNRPSNTYDTMKQGLYDQAGNFIPNDIGNQVLNPTDTYYNNQRQVFAYGGKVYEIGGQVDLDDNELAELAAAGFKLSRV